MGGELRDRDGRGNLPRERQLNEKELVDFFWEQFPFFLAIGMTADEYWNGDNRLCKSYLKAFEIKRQLENQNEHRLGNYFYHALGAISPLFRFSTKAEKAQPYLDEPFPLTNKEIEERQEREIKKRKEAFFNKLASMNRNSKEADTNG